MIRKVAPEILALFITTAPLITMAATKPIRTPVLPAITTTVLPAPTTT
ncbi:MAG: hypothetical protein H7255_09665, partial [Ramlibacter sp.]|nr:hypothetical protein [Ramlibacter sp.]